MRLPITKLLAAGLLLAAATNASAQLSGTKNIPGDYGTLELAIQDLNFQGVGAGGVTLNVVAANPQNAPAGGYQLTATGTLANPIVIQGNGNTVTASAALTAGSLNDAIFKLIGSDYVTLSGFSMQENVANTTTAAATNNMTEWGVALLTASTTDGAQNNTVMGNTIALDKTYTNTFGVYSNTRHSATDPLTLADITDNTTGPNNGTKIYGNSISNVNMAIVLIGSATGANHDVGTDVGGSSVVTGNTITNYGNAVALSAFIGVPTTGVLGIYLVNQNNYNVSYNSVTSASLNTSATLVAILADYTALPVGSITNNITNNTVATSQAGTGALQGIATTSTIGAASNVTQNTTNNNFIGNAVTATGVTMAGIANTGAFGTVNLNNNVVRNNTSSATTGGFVGVTNQGAVVNAVNIMNNQIGNSTGGAATFSAATTGTVQAISNTSAASTASVTITGNSVQGFSFVSSGIFSGILQTGAPGGGLTISNNNMGTASGNLITYSAANSTALNVISSTGVVGAGSTVNIQNNDIRGITYAVASSGANTYINLAGLTAAGTTHNITGNTFTNLNVNTTGTVTFILQTYSASSTSVKNTSNNSIVTAFNRGGGSGSVLFVSDNGSSVAGCISNCTNNNFSNVTVAGTSTITGLNYTDGGTAPTRTVTGNTISNIVAGSGALNLLNFTYWNGNSVLSGNTVNNVTGSGAITGINIGASANTASLADITSNTITNLSSIGTGGNVTGIVTSNTSPLVHISNNTINMLSSTGASTTVFGISVTGAATTNVFGNTINALSGSGATSPLIRGISVSAGATVNVYKNKIYDLFESGAIATTAGAVNGILISAGTTVNVSNNLIGDLRAPAANLTDAIRAINITSTTTLTNRNIFYNTIYLNATSSGTNFGSTGIFHAISTTATTSVLNMRNNIIVNNSTPNGTGLTVAYRRSAGAANNLANYGGSSNNNLFYAGTPSASRLIYSDGTSTAQTLAAYQSGVFTAGTIAPRDNNSISLAPSFISTIGGSADFLHIDPVTPTLIEGGAVAISGYADDYDGNARSALAPDVGADEFSGTTPAPVIASVGITPSTPQCVATARTVTVNVTSLTGITSATLDYNNGAAGSVSMALTSGTATNGTWSGTIPAASPANTNVTWSVEATDGTYTTSMNGASYKDAYLSAAVTTATATPSTVCAGSPSSLSVVTIDGAPGFVNIGTQTTTIGGNDGNPYRSGNGVGNQIRVQLLVLASELAAQGLGAGPITSVGLTTTGIGGTVANFTIDMKHTSLTAVTTSFDNAGFTNVFTQASFTTVLGLNTHTFTTPFVWDGVSNVLINFCQTNSITGTNTVAAFTPGYASNLNSAGTTTGCTAATGNIVTNKPILRFGGVVGINYTPTMTWSWTPGPLSGATPVVNPTNTTIYTANGIDANGCTVSSNPVTVTVNPLPSAPAATSSNQCGVGIPTASVSSTAGVIGNGTFLWYSASSGGTLLQGPALGGSLSTYYMNDFSSSTLTNSAISGTAAIGSGILTLHPALTNQQGGLTVDASGVNSTMYQTSFNLSVTSAGTTMADGFSYSFADDAAATTTTPTAEHGSGSKLRIGFFTFNTAGGSDGKGIYLMYNVSAASGYTATTPGVLAYSTDVSWIPVSATTLTSAVVVSINASGQLTLSVAGIPIFTNVQLPAGYLSADKSLWKHVFSSRSGGTAGGFAMDDLLIEANAVVPGYSTYQSPVSNTTTFYVSEMGVNGCASPRTAVTVNVTQPDAVTATTVTTPACVNSSLSLQASQTGNTNTYAYSWSANPAAGSGIPGAPVTGGSVNVVPTLPGTYAYTVTAFDGTLLCTTTSTVNITVNPQPSAPVVSPLAATICAGSIQQLYVNTPLLYNFGTQAAVNATANNATDFPAPYTVWWGGQRMQMLITAAELTSAGFSAGSEITSIQFPVVSMGVSWGNTLTALQSFQVNIGATSLTSLTAFQSGLTNVVAPASFTPTVGYNNTHTFSSPFTWDGTSNLILETTFSNNIGGVAGDAVIQYNSPTSYQATIVYRADNVTAAAAASATTVNHSYNARVDFKLNGVHPSANWSPSSGLFTDALATSPYTGGAEDTVWAQLSTSTSYTATAINSVGCPASTNVPVTVSSPSVAASATTDTSCSGSPFNLSANVLNNDFNGVTNNWTTINNSTGGTPVNAAWTLRNSPYLYAGTTTFSSNDASQFYMTNSDAQGSGGTTETILQSPAFSTMGMTSLNLDFYHYFRALSDNARVEVSTDGTAWTAVQTFTTTQGAANGFVPVSVNLNSYIGNPVVYVRFRYNSAYGWYWALDNVKVSGTSTNTFAWASTPAGFTSAVQNPTGVTATGTTTYNVTVTDGNNCTATSSVTVNIDPAIAGNTISSPQVLCSGSTPAGLNGAVPTGGNSTYSYLWQSSTTSGTGGFAPAAGVNNTSSHAPGVLTATTWYRRVVISGTCADTSSSIEITVTPGIANNTISASQSLCSGNTPAQLTGSTPTGAGGTYTYVWLSSTASAITGFAGASGTNTGINYAPGPLTANTWYRRVANSGTCSDTSAAVAISVSQPLTGNTISASQALCAGGTPVMLTGTITGIYEDFNGMTTTAGLTTANLPSGWTIALNQGSLLTGFNANSYGRPTPNGMFRSNNYSVGSGNVARLDSKTFGPSVAGDSLRFDIAYGAYDDAFGPYVDTLRIYANSGSGYTLLKQYITGLNVDTSENGVNTAPFGTAAFVPTAAQWTRKKLAIPTGSTSVRFEFASGFGNRMYVDRIQADSANFLWMQSMTGASSGFAAATGVNTNVNYMPPALSQTTWYRRVASTGGGCPPDTSAAVVISVSAPVTGNTISASQAICSGGTPAPLTGSITGVLEDFNGLTSTSGLTTAVMPAGWTVALNQGNLATGFNTNSYGRPSPNGAIRFACYNVGSGNVARIDSKNFGPSIGGDSLRFDVAYGAYNDAFGPYVDTLRIYTTSGSGYTLLKQYITGLNLDTSENGINTSPVLASSFTPTAAQWTQKRLALPAGTTNVRFELASGFGNMLYIDRVQADSASFLWLSSTTSATSGFTAASGTNTNSGYAPGPLTQNTWYRRVATLGACGGDTSAAVAITMNTGSTLAANGATSTYVHNDGVTYTYTDASCNPILTIQDASGGNTLGSVSASVAVTGTVQTAPNGQKYLQRSYTVTPASNGAATVTLYALQSEFTAYNGAPGAFPPMPTSGSNSDPNIANIRVTKYAGSPFVGGGNALLLMPSSVNWNATQNWWEITVSVNTFSSFYIHTGTIGPLDIELLNISAVNVGDRNRVDWMTAGEKDASKFEVERSADGIQFSYLGTVKAKGTASGYSFWDERPFEGLNYYRLKMIDMKDGYSFSPVVTAFVKSGGVFDVIAYPNPVTDKLTVQLSGKAGANGSVIITDAAGKLVSETKVTGVLTVVDMGRLAQGVYFMKYIDDYHSQTIKVNKH